MGDLDSAARPLGEALDRAVALHNRESLARALEALAVVADTVGDPAHGATLFGAAEGVRRSIGATVWRTDRASHARTEERLQTALGEPAFQAGAARGAALTVEEAVNAASRIR